MSLQAHEHHLGLKLLTLTCLLLATTAGTSQAAVNLVVNPGFETGNFTGWTTSPAPGTNFTFVVSTTTDPGILPPHGGTFEAKSGPPSNNPELLSQIIATIPGQTYEVSFWLANFMSAGTGSPEFKASFAGNLLIDFVRPNNNTTETDPYKQYVFDVPATGATSTLQFSFVQPPGYWLLDDVSVTPAPEASSLVVWSMLGLVGVAVVGKARRNRSLQIV